MLADRRPGLRADRAVRSLRRLPQGPERRALCDLRPRRRPARAHGRGPPARYVAYRDYDAMLADPQVEAVIIAIADQFHVPAAIEGDRGRQARAGRETAGHDRRVVPRAARPGGRRPGWSSRSATTAGSTRASPSRASFIREEMGQRIAVKSWYYDSVYRYTMTDNLQPIPLTSAQVAAAGGRSQGRPAALLHADARQPPGRYGAVPGRPDRRGTRPAARTLRGLSAGSSRSTSTMARSATSTCRSRSAAISRRDSRSSASTAA